MKKTDTVLKIMTVFFFCAMVVYMSVYLVRRFSDTMRTALAVTATMSDSSTISGLVFRDELTIQNDQPYIETIVSDGEKVSAGQVVARAYSSQEALDRALELQTMERQIEEVRSALESSDTVYTSGNRDESIFSAVESLSVALHEGDYTALDTRESTLRGLLFRGDTSNATETYLEELESAYRDLSLSAAEETVEIPVGTSGTFSSVIDGYEGIDLSYAETLSPSSLRDLIAADRIIDRSLIGKLISSYKWYYAAIVPREDARNLTAGMYVSLSFGRYYSDLLSAEVQFVGQAEGDEQFIIFCMDKGFDEMLTVRSVSAEIIYSEYTGLRVPLSGLYRYYAGYVSESDAAALSAGDEITLRLGSDDLIARISEIGSAKAYGDLPEGVKAGSDKDTRPKRCQVVLYWPWEDTDAPNFSAGGTLCLDDGTLLPLTNYYDYDPDIDRLCVFTMTGLQAERKKVSLIYAGDEYALVSSEGTDALREGNEIILQANGLHNGKVFQ